MEKGNVRSSSVKMLDYLKAESKKFIGKDRPFPNLSQLVNAAVRSYHTTLREAEK
jgi:hypothetical protein